VGPRHLAHARDVLGSEVCVRFALARGACRVGRGLGARARVPLELLALVLREHLQGKHNGSWIRRGRGGARMTACVTARVTGGGWRCEGERKRG